MKACYILGASILITLALFALLLEGSADFNNNYAKGEGLYSPEDEDVGPFSVSPQEWPLNVKLVPIIALLFFAAGNAVFFIDNRRCILKKYGLEVATPLTLWTVILIAAIVILTAWWI